MLPREAVRSFLGLRPPRGVVVIVSDLGDPSWSKAVDHLLHERHDVGGGGAPGRWR